MFTFFESVAYDQHMPWLETNRDDKKFRNILMKMGKSHAFDTPAFFKMMKIIHDEKILVLNPALLKECDTFAALSIQSDIKNKASLFTEVIETTPRLQFYILLAGHCVSASIAEFNVQITTHFPIKDQQVENHYPKYLINHSLKVLSDLLGNMHGMSVEHEEDAEIIRIMMLAICVVFFEIININVNLYEPFHVNFNAALGLNLLKTLSNSGGISSERIAKEIIRKYYVDGRFITSEKNINTILTADIVRQSNDDFNPELTSPMDLFQLVNNMNLDIWEIKEEIKTGNFQVKGSISQGEPDDDALITAKEAMKILGIKTSSTLNYHISHGHLKCKKVKHKNYYFKKEVENLAGRSIEKR